MSQGIESVLDYSEDLGWGLIVSSGDCARAIDVVGQYQIENRRWSFRQTIRPEVLFDWSSLSWVLLVAFFFWLQESHPAIRDAGLMSSSGVRHGEWWRLVTAIFLHANLGHLAANLTSGFVLLGLTMGCYGTGIGLLAALLAGAGGNVAAWIIFPEHLSLGASGMVMGCLGLLAIHSVSYWRTHPATPPKFFLTGLAAGIMLFVLTGLGPGTDVCAHAGGFIAGVLFGGLLALVPAAPKSFKANFFAGAVFCGLVAGSWWEALSRFSPV